MATSLRHPIDVGPLETYMSERISAIQRPIFISQFGFGQSNPTYLIKDASGQKYVMRKKPPGQLVVRSAHKIEREYRVLQALQDTSIPVPKVFFLCEDPGVLGTPFYVMEFLDGRIFEDPSLPGVSARERHIMWRETITTLAKLHSVDIDAIGLGNYGKRAGFYHRQIRTWIQSEKDQGAVVDVDTREPVGRVPGVENMVQFFSNENYQPRDRCGLIHGDFKIDNLVFHRTEPKIIGILDWEMSTIGNPLSDIANVLHPWTVLRMSPAAAKDLLLPIDTSSGSEGLPSIPQCLAWYRAVAGWNPEAEMTWADAFSLFRMSVVRQGITARYAARQASSSNALDIGRGMFTSAQLAENLIMKMKEEHERTRSRL